MQNFVMNDIISAIDKNVEMGNISSTEAFDLKVLTTLLYMKIYSKYKELEDFTMRLCDQSLELPSDKYEKTVEELEEELELMSDKLKKAESLREENDGLRANLAEKDEKVKELEQTICNLELRLKELEQK